MNDQEVIAQEIRLTLLAEPSSVVLARELVRYALYRVGSSERSRP
ncbi:hypothetical protein [Actinomadura vinacea]